jgi:hypothetical protein
MMMCVRVTRLRPVIVLNASRRLVCGRPEGVDLDELAIHRARRVLDGQQVDNRRCGRNRKHRQH